MRFLGPSGLAVLVLVSCGGGSAPLRPLPVPRDGSARARIVDQTGERLYTALSRGRPLTLLADDVALRALVDSRSASRYSALRQGVSARVGAEGADFGPLAHARYSGVCLQGARLEPRAGSLGLRADGWVFDRALVVGDEPGGRRLASWVEGTFVYSSDGFLALSLSRVEAPRWEHSDLEMAVCDMEVGIGQPRPVVDVTD